MTLRSSVFRRLTRLDAVLAAGGVLGLLVYLVLLPTQHPLGAARYAPGPAEAQALAEAFLAEKGYPVEGLKAKASLRRNARLLNALQATHGRPEAVRWLGEAPAALPAFYWEVHFEGRGGEEEEDPVPLYFVRLGQDGAVWEFRRFPEAFGRPPPSVVNVEPPEARDPPRRVDRRVLQAVMAPPLPTEASPLLAALTDSMLAASFAFDAPDSLWRQPPPTSWQGDPELIRTMAEGQERGVQIRIGLGPGAAVALARQHLAPLPWAGPAFRADSVWRPPDAEGRTARVRFARTEPLLGQALHAEVEVGAAGVLRDLELTFNPGAEAPFSGTVQRVADALQVGFIVIMVLVLVAAFFRRLAARLIDGRAALVDGVLLGLLMSTVMALYDGFGFEGLGVSVWIQLLIRGGIALVVGAATAVFAMVVSAAADSMTRAVWPEKLRVSSLLRLGAYHNVYTGRALVRGTLLGLGLLGLSVLFLALFPAAAVAFAEDEGMLVATSLQPMAMTAASVGVEGFFILLILLLGLGTYAYRLRSSPAPAVGVVALGAMLMQAAPPDLAAAPYMAGLAAVWGLVLGVAFWRFDFVTAFVAYFVAGVLWYLGEGWLVDGTPVWVDVLLAGLLIGGILVLGLVGVASGRTRREVGEYVPAYIRDLTQQERLKQEIAIARQVQTSLLPHRMPDVEGLDVAAMCLAALDIGGDYYDFIEIEPGRLAVVVGDVSGKGTQAAFYMTLTKGILQTLAYEGLAPAEGVRRLNEHFRRMAPRGTFISLIYGVFDVAARTFTFVRAGHNPVILKRAAHPAAEFLQPAGMAIGLAPAAVFAQHLEEVTLTLHRGDVLVFYTDGFSEAMNAARAQYGDERLAEKVGDVGRRSAGEILRAVTEDVHHFVEAVGRHDDMTMVVLKLSRRTDPVSAVSVRRQAQA
ncbi:MAG: PP2C family protein-serine/threonine phosphatase [Rhodothermales bacterium]|nr:PP2C family protein-serine/threonine phosphatase [Rhodothermales bacterium]